MLSNPYVTLGLMAIAVYLMRSSGYWLASCFRISSLFRTWLGYIPGCLMVSIVAPLLIKSTPEEWAGSVVTVLVMWKVRNLLVAMVSGITFVIVVRWLLA